MAKTYKHETKWTTKNQVSRSFYGYPDKPTGITIHHWGNDGQRFENVCDFLSNNNVPTSAHYVVEDGRVATLAVPTVATYHAGNTEANGSTIGIECRPECTQGDVDTVIQLIHELEQAYGNLKIYQHCDWFNTACAGRWGAKLPEIIAGVNKLNADAAIKASAKSASTTTIKKENNVASARELWSYTNSKINGAKDTYALLTECVTLLRRIAQKIGA